MSILLNGIFGEHDCADIRLGLPAGAVHLRDRKLIVAATVCDPPMFQDAIKQAAISTGSDVLISHHGFYPETLNHAYFSVASQIAGQLCQFDQMLLYVHRAEGRAMAAGTHRPDRLIPRGSLEEMRSATLAAFRPAAHVTAATLLELTVLGLFGRPCRQ